MALRWSASTEPNMSPLASLSPGVATNGSRPQLDILTSDALALVGDLARQFGGSIETLVNSRALRRSRIARGEERLDFLAGTGPIRERDWTVAPTPRDLERRIVEI